MQPQTIVAIIIFFVVTLLIVYHYKSSGMTTTQSSSLIKPIMVILQTSNGEYLSLAQNGVGQLVNVPQSATVFSYQTLTNVLDTGTAKYILNADGSLSQYPKSSPPKTLVSTNGQLIYVFSSQGVGIPLTFKVITKPS